MGQILPAEVSSVALLELSESDSAHLVLSFQLRKRIEPYDCAFSYMRSWFDPHVSCISKSVTPTLLAFFLRQKPSSLESVKLLHKKTSRLVISSSCTRQKQSAISTGKRCTLQNGNEC